MGAQPSAEAAFQSVTPAICRRCCCNPNTKELIEHFSEAGVGPIVQTVAAETKEARSSQYSGRFGLLAHEGWPVHFELELDELSSLGVLGFELRGLGPRPPHTFSSGSIYTGQWAGNSREGFGKQIWCDGARYEGFWSANTASGPGRFSFPDGSVYLGQWRANRFHGLGAYYMADGSSYRGTWAHGQCEGYGVEIRHEDDNEAATYWGRFSRGLKDGSGICRWSEGSEYKGEWRAGQISGRGCLESEGGSRSYRGQWHRAMKHGRGVYKWPDGRQHEGQYKLDEACGFGALTWSDGRRYASFWQNAGNVGKGLYTDATGAIGQLPPGLLASMGGQQDIEDASGEREDDPTIPEKEVSSVLGVAQSVPEVSELSVTSESKSTPASLRARLMSTTESSPSTAVSCRTSSGSKGSKGRGSALAVAAKGLLRRAAARAGG